VRYDPEGSAACRRAIVAAACGEPMRLALGDGACYGPFATGWVSRRMFTRTAGVGSACRAIRDEPVIGAYHGTCDPAVAFCCVPASGAPDACVSPYESVRTGAVEGRCQAAARLGEA